LGQPGHNRIAAGLAAADAMVDRIAGHSRRQVPAMPDLRIAPRSHQPGELSSRVAGRRTPRTWRRRTTRPGRTSP
jgi:hypothetical protein